MPPLETPGHSQANLGQCFVGILLLSPGSWCTQGSACALQEAQTQSTGEGNGKPLQYFCLENPMNSMKRQKDRTLKDELPNSIDAQYAPGDQWRNNSRKKEQQPAVDLMGDRSKVQCYKKQYCIGTWNGMFMNQDKLEVVKQEMAKVNIEILGISELKWTGICKFNSDDCYIYYCGQESLRRNGVAVIGNKKSLKCSTWMQSQKRQNDLCSFLRQTIQYHSNPSLCPDQ